MEGTQTFNTEVLVPNDAPDEWKQSALKMAEQNIGNKLFDILWQNKLPAVVDIDEQIEQNLYQREWIRVPNDRIRITVTITPVRYRNVELTSAKLYYTDWILFGKTKNIFRKLWNVIRKKS